MNTIVTIKSWKRPYYLKELFQSITTAYNFNKYKYIISIDNNDQTKNNSIAEVKKFKEAGADIQLFYQSINLGCAGNTAFCFDKAFNKTEYDYMIHIEEDNILGRDFFNWMEWAGEYTKNNNNIFAINSFTRKAQQKWYPEYSYKADENFYHYHFECGGPFALHRKTWDLIQRNGGLFGAAGPCNSNLPPEAWKKSVLITAKKSWAYPMTKYFRHIEGEKYCFSPMISRSNNVGWKECVHVPSKEWFYSEVYDDKWIESDEFKDIDITNITYKKPSDIIWKQPDYAIEVNYLWA